MQNPVSRKRYPPKKATKQKTKYEKRCMLVAPKIMETHRATRQKQAYVKIAISDDLARKIIESEVCPIEKDLPVCALSLEWQELKE